MVGFSLAGYTLMFFKLNAPILVTNNYCVGWPYNKCELDPCSVSVTEN